MVGSIVFERPQENALNELKKCLSQVDVVITREQDINNGAGVKLHGLHGNKQIAYVLYFNHPKGQSSKVVTEKSTLEMKTPRRKRRGIKPVLRKNRCFS